MTADWNSTAVDMLRRLWDADWSASMIADALNRQTDGGGDFNKNSVIGKSHRLGLANRGNPAGKSGVVVAEKLPRAPYERRDAAGKLKVSAASTAERRVSIPLTAALASSVQRRQVLFTALAKAEPTANDERDSVPAVSRVNVVSEPRPVDSELARAVPAWDGNATTLGEVGAGQCRYPTGGGHGASLVLCGAPVTARGCCAEHYRRCFIKRADAPVATVLGGMAPWSQPARARFA